LPLLVLEQTCHREHHHRQNEQEKACKKQNENRLKGRDPFEEASPYYFQEQFHPFLEVEEVEEYLIQSLVFKKESF